MFEDWLDMLQSGTFEVSIPTLTVASDEVGTLTGSAHISWNVDTGIRIQAVTNGGDQLTRLMFGGFGTPGHLIAHSTVILHFKPGHRYALQTRPVRFSFL